MTTKKVGQQILFIPLFCCCFWIRDPGSGMDKNQTRDKHPGSATLRGTILLLQGEGNDAWQDYHGRRGGGRPRLAWSQQPQPRGGGFNQGHNNKVTLDGSLPRQVSNINGRYRSASHSVPDLQCRIRDPVRNLHLNCTSFNKSAEFLYSWQEQAPIGLLLWSLWERWANAMILY